MVTVQWQALLVYHPLWDAQISGRTPQPTHTVREETFPTTLSLPGTTLQPMQTPDSERRRQRVIQTSAQQQQALTARLQQMETRLLQEEMAQLETEQKAQTELARQEELRQAEQEVEQALRQYQLPQADAEIKRRILQRLVRIRPDQRDTLNVRLQEVETEQQHLSETLRHKLASLEEETARRIRERTEAIEQEYARRREELRERSAQRLQAEQLRASVQVRAFADMGKPVTFPHTTFSMPNKVISGVRLPPPPAVPQRDIRSLIEQDVKRWVEAICRRHGWVPVWQGRAGVPDVTPQIAREMRGNMP
ncbi:MAG: hypothetical protein KatS3mg022_0646 [Armatimonadota bacterium]|nr:MAG: hypothetical protein KatS3mg022_0646 [Armatimonadota bacterium]